MDEHGSFPRTAVAKTLSQAVKATSIVRVMTSDKGKARKLKGVEVLGGKGYWTERVCDTEFKVSAPSFFQVNTAQAEKLVALALEGLELEDDAVVADLYCGIGTFTLPSPTHATRYSPLKATAAASAIFVA